MNKDIFVKNVDIELLREQRNFLLEKFEAGTNDLSDGLVNLLDEMLDIAEGYNKG